MGRVFFKNKRAKSQKLLEIEENELKNQLNKIELEKIF